MEQLDLEKYIEQLGLEKYIEQLEMKKYFLERSDDFCYTNGKMAAINELIREARKKSSES